MVHVKNSKATNHTAVYFEISPKPLSHIIWQKLNEIDESFRLKD